MKKIVVIGDVVSSKTILNRAEFQLRLEKILYQLVKQRDDLVSPYTITLGDEFQAVYQKADLIFRDFISILAKTYPERIRFSLGIGTIDTQINTRKAIGMDGAAFHYARSGINELKKSENIFIIKGLQKNNDLLNQILFLISHVSNKWGKTRYRVLEMLFDNKQKKEMSKKLAISDKAVYKNVHSGALETIQKIFLEISDIINESL